MSASDEQIAQRRKFTRAVACFRKQPHTGGVEPPTKGARNRSWWYNQAAGSGLFYYDYFIQQTLLALNNPEPPDWCQEKTDELILVAVRNSDPSYRQKNPITLQLNRGENSHSGVFDGTNATRIYAALGRVKCNGEYPSFFISKWTGTEFPLILEIYPYDGNFDPDTITWHANIMTKRFSYNQVISTNGQSVGIQMVGFPIVEDYCYFVIMQTVPAVYTQGFLNSDFNDLLLEY